MAFDRLEHSGNAIKATLVAPVNSGDTTLTLVDATGWPTGGTGPFYLEIDPGTASAEKILATSRAGNVLSGLVRGADGTTPVAHTPSTDAVVHIFTAAEADEANTAAHQTLGQVASVGDMLLGAGGQNLQVLPVGADNHVLVADSLSGGGMRWDQLPNGSVDTGMLINSAVTQAKLSDGAVTQAKMASSYFHRVAFSVTSLTSGRVTIPHGATFTPSHLEISWTAPARADSVGFVSGWVIDALNPIDATNVHLLVSVLRSGPVADLISNNVTCTGTLVSYL